MKKEKVESLRSSYLLRQFIIYFFSFSVTPLILLFYIFLQYRGENTIIIGKEQLTWLIMGLAVVSLLGFIGVRSSLKRIFLLSRNLKRALFAKIDEKTITDLAKGEGEVADLAKAFGEVFKKLESNIKELEYTKKKLQDILSKVGKALTSIENFDLLIQLILETAIDALGVLRGGIFFLDEDGNVDLRVSVGFGGVSKNDIKNRAISSVRWVINEKRTLSIPALTKEEVAENKLFLSPSVYVPLLFRDKILGVLVFSGKTTGDNFTEDELNMISNLSSQMAVSFENLNLNKDIERAHFETIAALAMAVEAKDPYSRGHSERVGKVAVKIGEELGLSDHDVETLRDASRLHDLGKIGIADKVLKKESALSLKERGIMLKHPTIGESIVKPLKTFHHLLDPIRHHHEFLDGSGYPDGLKEEDISIITRVLTIADIFDALSADRPYRKAMRAKAVKKEFQRLADDGKIDGNIVRVVFKMIGEKKL
jgi:HD-GYP domain-containing protein (c-di-GMP phosphodiesterase class II)